MTETESTRDTDTTHDNGLSSVGRVARLTGISPETLRVWERRYGRPQPVRLPSGHRRYSASEVRWLRRVAEALTLGWRPGKAVRATDAELDELLQSVDPPAMPATASDPLFEALWQLDGAKLTERLDALAEGKTTLALLSEVISPFLRRVGRTWADGELEIRHEHLASEVVEDLLRRRRVALSERVALRDVRPVLLATLPGERHALGLLMLAVLCAARGVPHHLLGPDLPLEEIALSAREAQAGAVAVSVSLSTGGLETDRLLAALGRQLPDDVTLLAGGAGARRPGRGPRRVLRLASLSAWNDWLERCE